MLQATAEAAVGWWTNLTALLNLSCDALATLAPDGRSGGWPPAYLTGVMAPLALEARAHAERGTLTPPAVKNYTSGTKHAARAIDLADTAADLNGVSLHGHPSINADVVQREAGHGNVRREVKLALERAPEHAPARLTYIK